jgi:outer membrane immunogenic protein
MRRIRGQLLCGVAAAALPGATAGLAADMAVRMPVKAPPAIAAPLWTGFYIGAHAGYSWGSVDGDTTHDVVVPSGATFPIIGLSNNQPIFAFASPGVVPFPGISRDVRPKGPLGGFQAGYNFQSGQIVYGLEADISWTGQRDTFNFSGSRTGFSGEDYVYQESLRAELQYMGTVRGRLGYAFGPLLPYATGGFAWGRMQADLNWTLTQLFGPTATFSGSQTQTLFGWTLGAGFEYALAQKWTAKAEYIYVDLGKEAFFSGIQGGGMFGLRDHILRAGLNYRL